MRDVPFDGWMLSPSLVPKSVFITAQRHGFSGDYYASLTKDYINPALVFNSRDEALAEADRLIAKQEDDLRKRRAALDKRIAAVAKARNTK